MTNIVIIGEAWGEQEEREQTPFVGPSGYELTKMLAEAGIHRADCFLTNVFNLRPAANDISTLCGPKAEGLPGYPYLLKGKYVRAEFAPELERLGDELLNHDPNLVLALGNTPLWALTGKTGISKIRGSTCLSTHTVGGIKLLPCYHPAAVLRQWELRPVTTIDFTKALRESLYPEIRRPERSIWIEPTLEDIHEFISTYITPAELLAVDIETSGTQITCIGFAPCRSIGIVIPFLDARKKNRSYWDDIRHEKAAWGLIGQVLLNRRIRKVFQNGLYDIAFLWRSYGIKVYGATEDTMLLHHALQPEALKGLEFLGSVYTDEGSWKHMRKHSTTVKKDD